MDILEHLEGPHELGYRDLCVGGFVADDAPFRAAQEIRTLRELEAMRNAIWGFLSVLKTEWQQQGCWSDYDQEQFAKFEAWGVKRYLASVTPNAEASGGYSHPLR